MTKYVLYHWDKSAEYSDQSASSKILLEATFSGENADRASKQLYDQLRKSLPSGEELILEEMQETRTSTVLAKKHAWAGNGPEIIMAKKS